MSNRTDNGDFILASASPRRRDLLRQVGLSFLVVPSRLRETNQRDMDSKSHALYWAAAKANDVARRYPQKWVLAGDTIVVLDGEILGKPASSDEAKHMLSRLRGRSHSVITGLCLMAVRVGVEERECVETTVYMNHIKDEDIDGYVKTGEPMDKAGAYAIQGIGGYLVRRIEGSYSNVVGLPLCEAIELLRRNRVTDLFK
ncbi:MAG: septum formation protein Maf [Deltaproteobacteria bacterium]|nr:MAG: septum formation protein Maf [Deltaproteobacteria bacterium]